MALWLSKLIIAVKAEDRYHVNRGFSQHRELSENIKFGGVVYKFVRIFDSNFPCDI